MGMPFKVSRGEVDTIYRRTLNFKKTGEILGISKQRVHQIVSGYSSRGSKTKTELLQLIKSCMYCDIKPAVLIHHIDKNPHNNNARNLAPLCHNCHVLIHRRDFKGKATFCRLCKRLFTLKSKLRSYGRCQSCMKAEKGRRCSRLWLTSCVESAIN